MGIEEDRNIEQQQRQQQLTLFEFKAIRQSS